jgi:hypothetical protein
MFMCHQSKCTVHNYKRCFKWPPSPDHVLHTSVELSSLMLLMSLYQCWCNVFLLILNLFIWMFSVCGCFYTHWVFVVTKFRSVLLSSVFPDRIFAPALIPTWERDSSKLVGRGNRYLDLKMLNVTNIISTDLWCNMPTHWPCQSWASSCHRHRRGAACGKVPSTGRMWWPLPL